MEQNETLAKYKYFLDFMFPENLLDYFEPVRMEEKPVSGESQIGLDELYQSELHIYLDERDNRSSGDQDLLHTVQVVGDAIEEIRMQSKREAVKEEKHPKTYKGKKRGRKPVRANARYIPITLSNGDTPYDLFDFADGVIRNG